MPGGGGGGRAPGKGMAPGKELVVVVVLPLRGGSITTAEGGAWTKDEGAPGVDGGAKPEP